MLCEMQVQVSRQLKLLERPRRLSEIAQVRSVPTREPSFRSPWILKLIMYTVCRPSTGSSGGCIGVPRSMLQKFLCVNVFQSKTLTVS